MIVKEKEETNIRNAWVAQSVKQPTLDFSSGNDLKVVRLSPMLGSWNLLRILSLLLPLLPHPVLEGRKEGKKERRKEERKRQRKRKRRKKEKRKQTNLKHEREQDLSVSFATKILSGI